MLPKLSEGYFETVFVEGKFRITLQPFDFFDNCFQDIVGAIERHEYFCPKDGSEDRFVDLGLLCGHFV